SAARDAVDHALGHQVMEGTPDRLPAHLVPRRKLRLGRQPAPVGVAALQDLRPDLAGEAHVAALPLPRPARHLHLLYGQIGFRYTRRASSYTLTDESRDVNMAVQILGTHR